ncbi:hypothetical protein LH452_11445 [Laribacter hongkongensis]|uniref:hypothetical protein n=1 Tax=Laribacter hongkongensis TaxID=168471 RepID=UPI001EFECCC5|nr:hypothetical protein [Laribacter hongkongensis]MCG9059541.1 hypothetical protein [Laribacter hongkongensis]MCG9086579.1 hypothetical protein [Laribacter hongkongensis]
MNSVEYYPKLSEVSHAVFLYLLVLLSHLPVIFQILKNFWLFRAPLLFGFFFGMFFFQAFGSIYVFIAPNLVMADSIDVNMFATVLIMQALMFSALLHFGIPFLRFHCFKSSVYEQNGVINIFILLLSAISFFALVYYRVAVAPFLVESLISGDLGSSTAYNLRNELLYETGYFTLLRFASFIVPAIIGTAVVHQMVKFDGLNFGRSFGVVVCCAIPLLNSDKGATLHIGLILIFAFIYYTQSESKFKQKHAWLLFATCIALLAPVLVLYYRYSKDVLALDELVFSLSFRIFGAYSQGTGAALSYVQHNDLLSGSSFPNVLGIFEHTRVDLESLMHLYVTGYDGALPVSAVSEMLLNFGVFGYFIGFFLIFLIVYFTQIFIFGLGWFGMIIAPFYAYLAALMWATGLFQTIVSFTNSALILFVMIVYGVSKVLLFLFKYDKNLNV